MSGAGHKITRRIVPGGKAFRVECSCGALKIDASRHNFGERRRQERRAAQHLAQHGAGLLLAAQAIEAPLLQ